ncbi:DNA-directed RNA polymerase subunit H [Haloarcula salina]|uniref:DNA-directed RNA polymerase subunit Rpo5 n=1 Tax=Haloarcula salina TaxID=1429914 RepID=A0AA41KL55_9EURY|nr:DNA-directed RNA polymerase subunit H [Haloarcula salina]MBV0902544.1 DNA-directed RNA polymerase subunit H [Haloarcula salina]
MVDVSQHDLVPDHSVVDEADLEAVLEEYDIKKTDLPKIKRTDKALPDDAEVGDVIRIERDSRTTDTAVVYRLVVE